MGLKRILLIFFIYQNKKEKISRWNLCRFLFRRVWTKLSRSYLYFYKFSKLNVRVSFHFQKEVKSIVDAIAAALAITVAALE